MPCAPLSSYSTKSTHRRNWWQPNGVICDLDHLDTLPPRETRCGLGEMAKYHFLTGDDLLALDMEARIALALVRGDDLGLDLDAAGDPGIHVESEQVVAREEVVLRHLAQSTPHLPRRHYRLELQ